MSDEQTKQPDELAKLRERIEKLERHFFYLKATGVAVALGILIAFGIVPSEVARSRAEKVANAAVEKFAKEIPIRVEEQLSQPVIKQCQKMASDAALAAQGSAKEATKYENAAKKDADNANNHLKTLLPIRSDDGAVIIESDLRIQGTIDAHRVAIVNPHNNSQQLITLSPYQRGQAISGGTITLRTPDSVEKSASPLIIRNDGRDVAIVGYQSDKSESFSIRMDDQVGQIMVKNANSELRLSSSRANFYEVGSDKPEARLTLGIFGKDGKFSHAGLQVYTNKGLKHPGFVSYFNEEKWTTWEWEDK